MSQTYTHTCECGKKYKDSDPEVYFCPSCVEERRKIAAQVDKQLANRPPKRKILTDYQVALEKGKTLPSANGGHATFVRASDLGINFS